MTLPDADAISTFGAPYSNYGVDPVDPTTDLSAALFNKMAADVAMMSRMVRRCEVAFVGAASAPTVSSFEALWKAATVTSPTTARTGSGVFTFTFPASVLDELGETHVLNLTSAKAWAEGATAYHCQASATGAVITVNVFDMAGAANDAVGATIRVVAR